MSLNVLVIPEDFRKDQYILAPLIKRMFAEIGKPNAKVRICQDPMLGGIDQAMNWDRIKEVIDMYPMVAVFLLIVDRDGKPGRRERLNQLEAFAKEKLGPARTMLAENAWQEIEVWALAGQELPSSWKWKDVREDVDPKENYFAPHASTRKLLNEPGKGRTTMGREAAENYARVRKLCQELADLERRIESWL